MIKKLEKLAQLLGSTLIIFIVIYNLNSCDNIDYVKDFYSKMNNYEKKGLDEIPEDELIYLLNTNFGLKVINYIDKNKLLENNYYPNIYHNKKLITYCFLIDLKKKSSNNSRSSTFLKIKTKDMCEYFNSLNKRKNSIIKVGNYIYFREKISQKLNKSNPIECWSNDDWVFSKNDLIVKARLLQNNVKYDYIPDNVFMKVKIVSFNKVWNYEVTDIKVNDVIDLNLRYDIIQTKKNSLFE